MEVGTLAVELRETVGKRRNRRMRNNGKIPAVLYGHKQAVLNLTLDAEQVQSVLRHGGRFVQLKGAVNEKALIKDCQWDTWGKDVLHIDFNRVGEHEKIKVSVPVELRGEAPGVHEGGVVKQVLHSLELECAASAVPESISVNINSLGLDKVITVADLVLSGDSRVLADATQIVVSCTPPVEVAETSEEAGVGEPEVIGRKKSDEDGAE
ncbi:MAG: 50S ribosomal protein L25 [Thermoguttaceae bacterium]